MFGGSEGLPPRLAWHAGGGLSSSAAIVCASALAVMRMHGIELTKGVRPGGSGSSGTGLAMRFPTPRRAYGARCRGARPPMRSLCHLPRPAPCPHRPRPPPPLLSQEVSEFTARAERYVGVTSGGMDQAISVMGMPGIAKLVEFNPVGGGAHKRVPARASLPEPEKVCRPRRPHSAAPPNALRCAPAMCGYREVPCLWWPTRWRSATRPSRR